MCRQRFEKGSRDGLGVLHLGSLGPVSSVHMVRSLLQGAAGPPGDLANWPGSPEAPDSSAHGAQALGTRELNFQVLEDAQALGLPSQGECPTSPIWTSPPALLQGLALHQLRVKTAMGPLRPDSQMDHTSQHPVRLGRALSPGQWDVGERFGILQTWLRKSPLHPPLPFLPPADPRVPLTLPGRVPSPPGGSQPCSDCSGPPAQAWAALHPRLL